MIGMTNIIIPNKSTEPDSHTLFLMRDKIRDESKNHIPIYMVGGGNNGYWNAGGGVFSSITEDIPPRDSRNYIQFLGGGNSLYLGKANIVDQLGDWTVECWRYIRANVAESAIYHQRYQYAGGGWGFLIGYPGVGNHASLYLSDNGTSWNIVSNANIGDMSNGAWHHMAVCKSGNTTYYCFVDGILTNTVTGLKTPTSNIARIAYIGGYAGQSNSLNQMKSIDGALQDLRISDICRYTSNFTPPERL